MAPILPWTPMVPWREPGIIFYKAEWDELTFRKDFQRLVRVAIFRGAMLGMLLSGLVVGAWAVAL